MRAEKQLLLDEVKEKIEGSKGFIIAKYQKLDAAKARSFRDSITEAKGDFEVVRKKVFAKAAEATGLKIESQELEGHVGIIFAKEDPLELSKIAVRYGEQNEKAVEILAAFIDGQLCKGEEVVELTKLPNIVEMRSQLLGILQAPMAQVVGLTQSALTSLLYCLEEKGKKEPSQEERAV